MRIRVNTGLADSTRAQRDIDRAARQEGYALEQIFVDRDANRPDDRLRALLQAARRTGVRAVIVSSWTDLGLNPAASTETRRRLQGDADLVVWCAETLLASPGRAGPAVTRPLRARK
jgi:hypothetical protein